MSCSRSARRADITAPTNHPHRTAAANDPTVALLPHADRHVWSATAARAGGARAAVQPGGTPAPGLAPKTLAVAGPARATIGA
jgi:hypothetical protein